MDNNHTSPNLNPLPNSHHIRELIGRLGTVYGDMTHLNSSSKLDLSALAMAADSDLSPGLPFFGVGRNQGLRLPETARLSRVSSNQSMMTDGLPENKEVPFRPQCLAPGNGEFGSPREEFAKSGDSGGARGAEESNARKRKAVFSGNDVREAPVSPAGRGHWKMAEEDDANVKRSRSIVTSNGKGKNESKPETKENSGVRGGSQSVEKHGKDKGCKSSETPSQDYIHVRARRGQATDSHSLAERVRREKISERMKFLQDLVPGCNKVTGKAVMLDEIINYVQSLQRQVEFLSMKLATVNPHLEFNMENLLNKNIHQLRGSLPSILSHPMDVSALAMPFSPQPSQTTPLQSITTNRMENKNHHITSLDATLGQALNPQPTVDGFEYAHSQLRTVWEDDLQSVVQMGFLQNQKATFSQQQFHATLPTTHKKFEQ